MFYQKSFLLFLVFSGTVVLIRNLSFATSDLPVTFSLQGRFLNEAGTAPLKGIVSLSFGIYSPDSNCLLYEEIQAGIDLGLSEGGFSLEVGSIPGDLIRRTENDLLIRLPHNDRFSATAFAS